MTEEELAAIEPHAMRVPSLMSSEMIRQLSRECLLLIAEVRRLQKDLALCSGFFDGHGE